MEDPRLIDVHKAAVTEMAEEIGALGRRRSSQVRRAMTPRVTSNLVIARYEHDASRELDPQLHTHLVAGNLGLMAQRRQVEGVAARWRFTQQREYLTEVYRNAAARGVLQLGYQIEDHSQHGKDNGFGIVGIREETRDKYSRRSAQKEAADSGLHGSERPAPLE